MVFYQIRLSSLPEICFAHSLKEYRSKTNRNIIDHRPDMIEFAFLEKFNLSVTTEQDKYTIPENSIAVFMPDQRYELCYPYDEAVEISVSCISVKIAALDFQRHNRPVQEVSELIENADKNTLFVPQFLSIEGSDFHVFQSKFKSIMNNTVSEDPAKLLLALSIWFELLAMIHTQFLKQFPDLNEKERISLYHTTKAIKFIDSHFCSPIQTKDVADHLKISTVYLSSLFRRETGYTVTEYINKQRMEHICTLIQNNEGSLSEICSKVGLQDKRYVQRLFKKHFGISMSRYQQLIHGLTLFVDDPYIVENLDHDIYFDNDKSP